MHLCASLLGVSPVLPSTLQSGAEPGRTRPRTWNARRAQSLPWGWVCLGLPGLWVSPGPAFISAQGTGTVAAWVGWESTAPGVTLEAHLWLASSPQVPFLLSICGVMWPRAGPTQR